LNNRTAIVAASVVAILVANWPDNLSGATQSPLIDATASLVLVLLTVAIFLIAVASACMLLPRIVESPVWLAKEVVYTPRLARAACWGTLVVFILQLTLCGWARSVLSWAQSAREILTFQVFVLTLPFLSMLAGNVVIIERCRLKMVKEKRRVSKRKRVALGGGKSELSRVDTSTLTILGLLSLFLVSYDATLAACRVADVSTAELNSLVALSAAALTTLSLGPLLMIRTEKLDSLSAGPLRSGLERLTRDARVGLRDILIRDTNNTIFEAKKMGILAPWRYIVLSDRAVRSLSEEHIRAVFAHELAHVQQGHAMYALAFAAGLGGLGYHFEPKMGLGVVGAAAMLTALMIAMVAIVFVHRAFEYQADLEAARILGGCSSESDCVSRGGTIVVGALRRIVTTRDRLSPARSVLHPSRHARIKLVADVVVQPDRLIRYRRLFLGVKVGIILSVLAAVSANLP
jgi:Zn-dependent protease with chaperone function